MNIGRKTTHANVPLHVLVDIIITIILIYCLSANYHYYRSHHHHYSHVTYVSFCNETKDSTVTPGLGADPCR